MRITVIGAGSTYTPELMEGLLEESSVLDVSEVVLMDRDPERLAVVGGLVMRMASACRSKTRVVCSLSLEEAVAGADYVVLQIRVGGQPARHVDTLICQRHGVLGQETTGAAGFAKAMRTIPVALDILGAIHRSGTRPVVINFTNPSGMITEALASRTDLYVLGLCNIPTKMRMKAGKLLGKPPDAIRLDYVGLNHLAWIRGVYCEDEDVTARVLDLLAREPATDGLPPPSYEAVFLEALGAAPVSYLKYYYLSPEMREITARQPKTRAQEVMEIERRLLALYADPALDRKPAELEKRGGAYYSRAAVDLIKSIALDLNQTHVVNVVNRGAVPDFPEDAVVEVPAAVGGRETVPQPTGRLNPAMLGLMHHVKAYERLTIEAATKKDYRLALLALSTNPLVPSVAVARRLLDDFIEAHGLDLS